MTVGRNPYRGPADAAPGLPPLSQRSACPNDTAQRVVALANRDIAAKRNRGSTMNFSIVWPTDLAHGVIRRSARPHRSPWAGSISSMSDHEVYRPTLDETPVGGLMLWRHTVWLWPALHAVK